MPNVINGTSTGSGGLITSGDDSGILNIQTNETTAITVDASQVVTFAKQPAGTFAGTGPAFSAFQGTTQTIALSTLTKVSFNTERFDTSACFDTTLFRFTPNIAGYYQINVSVMFDYSISQYSGTTLELQKNGTTIHIVATTAVNWYGNRLLNEVVYMNGTTDYLEVYGSITGGAGPQFLGGTIYNSFSGAMVRAA